MSSKRRAVEVAIFVHRAGQLLLCHRTREDYWHVVAGALEPGENLAQAAKRELLEETGLDGDPRDLGLPQTYAVTDEVRGLYDAGTAEVVVGNFHIAAPEGWEPILNEEHDGYDWADPDVAAELVRWPETRRTIDVLGKRLRARA